MLTLYQLDTLIRALSWCDEDEDPRTDDEIQELFEWALDEWALRVGEKHEVEREMESVH